MKKFYLLSLISLALTFNESNAQTVTVDDPTPGALTTYTFTYVTSHEIGTGTSTPNIIYLGKPSTYPDFVAVNPLGTFGSHAIVKVDGQIIPINETNFGSTYGSWSGGIQISTGGATEGTTIPSGATIEIAISNIITNPLDGVHTINWKTAQAVGNETETFSVDLDFSALSLEDSELQAKNLTVFPNPSMDFVQVSGLTNSEKYSLFDTSGKEIQRGTMSENTRLNIKNLAQGTYFLKFENTTALKFIKN